MVKNIKFQFMSSHSQEAQEDQQMGGCGIKYIITQSMHIGNIEKEKRKRKKRNKLQNICAPSPSQNLSEQERDELLRDEPVACCTLQRSVQGNALY